MLARELLARQLAQLVGEQPQIGVGQPVGAVDQRAGVVGHPQQPLEGQDVVGREPPRPVDDDARARRLACVVVTWTGGGCSGSSAIQP